MKLSVLGCGRWGSFLAWYLDNLAHDVWLWGRKSSPKFIELKKKRKNDLISFADRVELTHDLEAAIAYGDILLISISSQGLDQLMQKIAAYKPKGKTIVLCMKGLEESTGRRLTEIVEAHVGEHNKVAIWVGPGHVQDFVAQKTNCMVIDAKDDDVKVDLVSHFSSDLIRFYYGDDIIGNEVGAAAKNVIGIAAGMLDGLEHASLKGALMSRGTREISRLIKAMGGNEMSAYGLSHLGDYEATVFSKHSHNRRYGESYVRGLDYDELAEGVSTTRALMVLSKAYDVELPICRAVYAIIYEDQDPEKVLNELFLRSLKGEFMA